MVTTIEAVSACTVRVPLAAPTAFATRRVLAREYALVKVRGDDGVEGIGFCYAGAAAGALARTPTGSRACGMRCTANRCSTAAPARSCGR